MPNNTTAPMGALVPIALDEQALRVAAWCAEDVFDTPDARHIEAARRYVAAYLGALAGQPSQQPPTPPAAAAQPYGDWPDGP